MSDQVSLVESFALLVVLNGSVCDIANDFCCEPFASSESHIRIACDKDFYLVDGRVKIVMRT